jgi:hypothetical protein
MVGGKNRTKLLNVRNGETGLPIPHSNHRAQPLIETVRWTHARSSFLSVKPDTDSDTDSDSTPILTPIPDSHSTDSTDSQA